MADTGETSGDLGGLGDSLDMSTFEQILEMDEPDDDEFSRSIVFGFFEQAENTFTQMQEALDKKDLDQLSSLGHFLKGSSATLGLTHMRNSCEKIQHLGQKKDATGSHDQDEDQCLKEIKTEIEKLRKEYVRVEAGLKKFYAD